MEFVIRNDVTQPSISECGKQNRTALSNKMNDETIAQKIATLVKSITLKKYIKK